MIRTLPFLIEVVLLVYCLVHVIQTPDAELRNLPKWAWILLILFFPLVGCIAYLVAGRPVGVSQRHWAPGSGFPENERQLSYPSDIDSRLEADLARLDREHEESLRRWEADLRKREQGMGDDASSPPSA
ncbi:MAG TPA: PLD nuclease N-terminal domain-containing protein [Actinomycetes bacterium]|nr:PLD nuclease N-terminal domain-containing protein [Actinomycetes bacterium]